MGACHFQDLIRSDPEPSLYLAVYWIIQIKLWPKICVSSNSIQVILEND